MTMRQSATRPSAEEAAVRDVYERTLSDWLWKVFRPNKPRAYWEP
jgi:hypothetical protein